MKSSPLPPPIAVSIGIAAECIVGSQATDIIIARIPGYDIAGAVAGAPDSTSLPSVKLSRSIVLTQPIALRSLPPIGVKPSSRPAFAASQLAPPLTVCRPLRLPVARTPSLASGTDVRALRRPSAPSHRDDRLPRRAPRRYADVVGGWRVICSRRHAEACRRCRLSDWGDIFSSTTPVLENGEVNQRVLRREFLNRDELDTQLQPHGVDDVSSVQRAHLEPSGMMSAFK